MNVCCGVLFFLKASVHKRERRDSNSGLNDTKPNVLRRRGLGTSFEGYYTFAEALDVALSKVKEHAFYLILNL